MTAASSPGWPWGCWAAVPPLRCGLPVGGWKRGSSPVLSSWRSSAWAVHRNNRWGLLAASVSLAAAALTRPEGLLLAACCFGWFAVQRVIVDRRLDWRELTYLVAPFAILVTAHFLFRYGYYGEWLPNTYYAKHVRPWYESGFRYLWAAALETGLYLLLPLAWVALRERWRR